METQLAKLRGEMSQIKDQLNESEWYKEAQDRKLMELLAHHIATISDLRDLAMLASSQINAGEIRSALETFFDSVVIVCDIDEKKQLLQNLYSEHTADIDALLRNQDGTSR